MGFPRYINRIWREDYSLRQIGNADQTTVYLNMPSCTTVSAELSKDVSLLTGYEHTWFTVMLCCMAVGQKLPSYIVFRQKTILKNEKFPKKVIIRANEKGFMNEAILKEWFQLV